MSDAATLAARVRSEFVLDPDPWPHGTLDDFLPAAIFGELLGALAGMKLECSAGRKKLSLTKPGKPGTANAKWAASLQATVSLLTDSELLDAIRARFGFAGGAVQLEVGWFGAAGLSAHVDRDDKLWNGQVYLAGDPKGTELYGPGDKLARVLEWAPNRMTCWPPPGASLKHAAPASKGRFVLLWWILREKPATRAERKQQQRKQRGTS